MNVIIDIENCKDCPFGWSHRNHDHDTSVVCDKLQENVGTGLVIHPGCPLKE